MIIHQPTLLLVCTVIIAFSGFMLVMIAGPRHGTDSLRVWGGAMLAGALGLLILGADPYPSWRLGDVGTAILVGATAISWMAARIFGGRRPRPYLSAAGPAFWLVTIPLHTPSAFWIAAGCAMGAGYTALTAFDLWRARAEYLPSRRPALIVLAGHSAVYLTRAGVALLGDDGKPWATAMPDALVAESLLDTLAMAFLLLAMVKERVELRSSEHLRALALQDSLTGIANRRRFDEHVPNELRRARRLGASVAMLMIDIDHFKRYNDSFGHQRGDACLRAVAQAIAGTARRPGDLVARYGGEEFAVILPHAHLVGAVEHAERIRAAVEALDAGTGFGKITVSVGVAALIPDGADGTLDTLVQAADDALYAAKSAGRNVVRAASPPSAAASVRQGAL